MMMVALIMRPWIVLMNTFKVACFILADDVLILSHGKNVIGKFVDGLNNTHLYLQAMGAKVAPDKSFNFASNGTFTKWLQETTWEHLQQGIDVVKDFRYL